MTRIRNIILIVLALIGGLIAYFLYGRNQMRVTALAANIPTPSSPYTEVIAGAGDCQPLKITVLGDSTAIGVGTNQRSETFSYQFISAHLLPRHQQVTYTNRAISGAIVADLLTDQLPAAITDQPDLVIIAIGANNVTAFTSEDDFSTGLTKILDSLITKTQAKIILLGIPSIKAAPILLPLFPPLIDINNQRLIGTEENLLPRYQPGGRLLAVELYNSTGDIFQNDRSLFAPDGYHPGSKGYAVWAKRIGEEFAPRQKEFLPCPAEKL